MRMDAGARHQRPVRMPSATLSWQILVVEENTGDMEALARGLLRHGHEVIRAGSGSEALDAHVDADLILLDLELSDLDGLEVCRGVRAVSDIPIIVVTARHTELDRVLGLQAGADDYVVKPYGFRELMARLDAVMRRARPAPVVATESRTVVSHGELRIDAGWREVTVAGQLVEVTRKEFDLLALLAANPGGVVSRTQIMHQVWGDSWSRRTLDTHVSSLRNKLGDREWIVTVRGVGFRLGGGERAAVA